MISIQVVVCLYYNTGIESCTQNFDCRDDNFGTFDIRRSFEIVSASQKCTENLSGLDRHLLS